MMNVSRDGFDLIMGFEGLRLEAYKCQAGVWTIGWGHTKDVYEGMTITQKQAGDFLIDDVAVAEKCVNKTAKTMNSDFLQNQFDALVSFVFNLGCSRFNGSTLRKKILNNSGSDKIQDQWMRWVYADGKKSNGLVIRRKKEVEIYIKGYAT